MNLNISEPYRLPLTTQRILCRLLGKKKKEKKTRQGVGGERERQRHIFDWYSS